MSGRHFRLVATVAAISACGLALGACSSGSGGGTPSGSSSGAGPDSLEVFSYWTSGSEEAALTELINLYQKTYPGVKVTNGAVSGGGGSNAAQVLQSRISGGDAPDTWQTHPGASMQVYTQSNLVEDLTSIYESEGWRDAMPASVVDTLSSDGKVYGVVSGAHRINVLWYSKKFADQLGINVGDSLTWDALVQGMQKAKDAGITPICLGDKDIFASSEILETLILAQLGADDWKKLASGEITWSDPRIATALSDYGTILDNANSDHTALSWDQGVKQFAQGSCAFLPVVDSGYGELVKDGAVDGTDFGYVPFPGTDDDFLQVSDVFVVNAKLADKTAAENWIKLLGSAEGQQAFNKIKGSTPVRTDVDTSSYGPYQQWAAKEYRSTTNVDSMVFAQAVSPSVQQAFYDAATSFGQARDAAAFAEAMNAAAAG